MPAILREPPNVRARPNSPSRIDLASYTSADFNRGASRVKEACWVLVKCAFFLNPLPLPSRFRCMLLRWFGAKVGMGVIIRSRTNISFPWRLTIGNHSWVGEEVEILSLAPITIGDHVCISQRAYLCTGSHDFRSPDFNLITQPVVIASHCWIAATAFICPGVTIGEGSMVGAGVTVTRDVPSGARLLPGDQHLQQSMGPDQ